MNHDYNLACAHIAALTGNVDTVVDFRILHDTDKGVPGINRRGRIADLWGELCTWNLAGYGVFLVVNATDGQGVKLPNITQIRAHFADLDNVHTSLQALNELSTWQPAPSFMVNTSAGKYHVYWCTSYPTDQHRFDTIQAKLIARFSGDPNSRDMARVLRLSGLFHMKVPSAPYLVTCCSLTGYGYTTPPEALEQALSSIQVGNVSGGGRHELGDPSLAAPDFNTALQALYAKDPNNLDRSQWISHMAAWKQAVSTLVPEQQSRDTFFKWCEQYEHNDIAENTKQWNSIRQTSNGWQTLKFGASFLALGDPTTVPAVAHFSGEPVSVTPAPEPVFTSEILDPNEQRLYFRDCYFVTALGKIWDLKAKYALNQTQFNGRYGGKMFVVTAEGKTDKSPWTAATLSTQWTVPKVDHIRFVPERASGEIIMDALNRKGLNIYIPATIKHQRGDPAPFLRHMELILPDAGDRKIFFDYLAHNIKYPGHKIPWAPLIQSEEGAGKGVIKMLMTHAIGSPYVYFPNAKELAESGAKFNAWMRAKLFILVDEIKVDDRRDMIEILKPMISEKEIEIQGKGYDQEKEDNYSNWAFFSNYKDAIPISKNGRRFAIFYSAIQSVDDLLARGMDKAYFDGLYAWMQYGGGNEIVTDYFLNYPIERNAIDMRAPSTSSKAEALENSMSQLDRLVGELVEDQKIGFRDGWISLIAFKNAARAAGVKVPADSTLGKIFESAGYKRIGRALRGYNQEDMGSKSMLYSRNPIATVGEYGRSQGYE